MKKIKACAIILNKAGEILLQLRDEEPEKGKWVLFGGGVKDGEDVKDALIREIKEELGYQIENFHYFRNYANNGVEQAIFVVEGVAEIDELKLGEGLEMKFFKYDDLNKVDIGFNFRSIIGEWFDSLLKNAA